MYTQTNSPLSTKSVFRESKRGSLQPNSLLLWFNPRGAFEGKDKIKGSKYSLDDYSGTERSKHLMCSALLTLVRILQSERRLELPCVCVATIIVANLGVGHASVHTRVVQRVEHFVAEIGKIIDVLEDVEEVERSPDTQPADLAVPARSKDTSVSICSALSCSAFLHKDAECVCVFATMSRFPDTTVQPALSSLTYQLPRRMRSTLSSVALG